MPARSLTITNFQRADQLTFFLSRLLRRLHGVVVWEYNTIFNTKYFIINSKILAYVVAIVQRCWHTYTYIHT